MRIAIVGVGALGMLFGARLSPVAEVTLIGRWPAQLATLREAGITLRTANGREHSTAVAVTDDPATAAPADVALILVKSYQSADGAARAGAALAADGLAITLQNGLGNLEPLAAVVGAARAVPGTTSQGATFERLGVVRHAGDGPTYLGRTPATAERVAEVAAIFRQAGFETIVTDALDVLLWRKVAVSAAINPLTALADVPNGVLLQRGWRRAALVAAAEEAGAVARARGVALAPGEAARLALEVARATAGNASSMRQDLRGGRPTEIDAICGAIVAAGRQAGVATPINARLLAWVKAAEAGRPPVDWARELARLVSAGGGR